MLKSFVSGLVLLGVAAQAANLSGRVEVRGRSHPEATTIVYAEPLDVPAAERPIRATMAQHNKTFIPHVVVVPVNSIIDFPNRDEIFHNIFSDSPAHPFDLGLYRSGASKSVTFREPGSYRVFCNIHPQMTGVLLVLATPHFVETDGAGNYRMDLPPGRYRVTAWSERSQPTVKEVSLAGNTTLNLALDESKFVELPHKNKYGQDYGKGNYDPLRGERPQ